MKIAFIVPKGSKYGKNQYLKDFLEVNDIVYNFYGMWETPNLSLLTIAGLMPDDYDCEFIDEDHGQVIDFDRKYDIVAITGMTQQINRAYEIADEFRSRKVYVVIGGIHASIMPEEACKYADTVMIGEGEIIWKEFLYDYEKCVPKRIYESKSLVDLTSSPIPRYDLVDSTLYNSYSIQTSRGCNHTCKFCTLPIMYGNTYRFKDISQIINEVEAIKKINQNAFIFFVDDNMFVNRKRSYELLKKIAELDIKWGTQTDISIANDAMLLEEIKKAGCHWLFIGFENTSISGLEFLDEKCWKARQSTKYTESIKAIHDAGLNIWASFMFGGDMDTIDTFDETLKFALDNEIYSGSFTILTPLPGTQLYIQMKKEHRIIDYNWSRYTFWDVVFEPKNMTPKELAEGVAYVYEKFYSMDNVRKRLLSIRRRMKGKNS